MCIHCLDEKIKQFFLCVNISWTKISLFSDEGWKEHKDMCHQRFTSNTLTITHTHTQTQTHTQFLKPFCKSGKACGWVSWFKCNVSKAKPCNIGSISISLTPLHVLLYLKFDTKKWAFLHNIIIKFQILTLMCVEFLQIEKNYLDL